MVGLISDPITGNPAAEQFGLDRFKSSTGEVLGADAESVLHDNTLGWLIREQARQNYETGFTADEYGNLSPVPQDYRTLSPEEATAKYGIKVQSDQPDVDSAAEIKAAQQLAGTGRQPDIFDLGSVVAQAHTDMYAPYKPATWADIPDGNKEPSGAWINNYTGFETIGYDAKLGTITKFADLADPKYKGKVALNGDPLKASAGFIDLVRRLPS